jgi:hypothetical protein
VGAPTAAWGRAAVLAGLSLASLQLAACLEIGGLNQNEQSAGSQDGGVNVQLGDIAIDPGGRYLLARANAALVFAALDGGEPRKLVGVDTPVTLAFDGPGDVVFVATDPGGESGSGAAPGRLVALDPWSGAARWSEPVDVDAGGSEPLPRLHASETAPLLVVSGTQSLTVRKTATGEALHMLEFDAPIVDVDLTPDGVRAVVTLAETWTDGQPNTVVELVALWSGARAKVNVPNCSAELAVAPDGARAFLAPTDCREPGRPGVDPISVIDLEAALFERNLPGFGPVALARDGGLLVGFLDMEDVEPELFDDPSQIPPADPRYHMMLVDPVDLSYRFVAVGDSVPRYGLTPDGEVILIDEATWLFDGGIRLLDPVSEQLVTIDGPALRLDHYAITSDSRAVYLLQNGLYELDLAARRARKLALEFTPTRLNLTPDDAHLLLRRDGGTIKLFDRAQEAVVRTIDLAAAFDPAN